MKYDDKQTLHIADMVRKENAAASASTLTEADIILLNGIMNFRLERSERMAELKKPEYEGA